MKKIVLLAFVLVLLSTAIVLGFVGPTVAHTNKGNSSHSEGKFVSTSSKTIWVPDNFTSIQEAINNASDGDTIFVRADTYYENVVVNKSVSLIGENKYNTIIDGKGGLGTGTVVDVTVNNTNISCFTIQNSGGTWPDSGIYVDHSSGNNISHNIITNNWNGISFEYSNNSVLSGNTVSNNWNGIYFHYSNDNILTGNSISSNDNIGMWHTISSNNNLTCNTFFKNTMEGIYLVYSKNVTLSGNTARQNSFGINLEGSSNNNLTDNDASKNYVGIYLDYSHNNTLTSNGASNNYYDGIYLYGSSNNTLKGNTVSNNNDHGITLKSTILSNSSYNVLTGNNVSNNQLAIWLYYSSDNAIFHNNFIDNVYQVDVTTGYTNIWDDGYPSGGNYWSDYTDVDVKSGPNQDQPSSDGIGDTPYEIDVNNQDNYPLMGPISFFNAGTWDETTYYVHTVSNSTVSGFYFSEDEKLISFNITGLDGTVGFCRVTIPNELLWCDTPEQWTVLVNNTAVPYRVMENGDCTYLYFNYSHSIQNVQIIGGEVIPEFPTWISMLLILIVLTVAIAIYKRRLL